MIRIRSFLLAAAVAGFGLLFSADAAKVADTVYMKSGEVIQGKIGEEQPGQYLRIKVSPAATWLLYFREIDRVIRDGQPETTVAKQPPAQEAAAPVPAVAAPVAAPVQETPAPTPAPETSAPVAVQAATTQVDAQGMPASAPVQETSASIPTQETSAQVSLIQDTANKSPSLNKQELDSSVSKESAPSYIPYDRHIQSTHSDNGYPRNSFGLVIGPGI